MDWKNYTSRTFFVYKAKPSFLLLVLIVTLVSCDSGKTYNFKAESMHWLQFRGPDASGIAPENANPPIHFSADTNLLWKTEILPGWSSPCIVNEKIFLTGFNDIDSLLYVFAIDRENGEILWQDSIIPNGFYNMHAINSYANPTIASDGERIYAEFMNYGLLAYDLSGNRLWEHPHKTVSAFYGGANSPIIKDNTVVLKISTQGDSRIMGLGCENGDSIWAISWKEHKIRMGSTSTPVIKGDFLVNHGPGILWSFDLAKQKIAWQIPVPGAGVATPVIAGEDVLINTYVQLGEEKVSGEEIAFSELIATIDENNNGLADQGEFPEDMVLFIRPEISGMDRSSMYFKEDRVFAYFDNNKDKAFDEEEWNNLWDMMTDYMRKHGMMAVSFEGTGNRNINDIKWKVNEDTPETPSPLMVNDHAFFIKNGGIVTVIQIDSGNVVLKDRLGAPGAYVSSPMLAGDQIYTCSFNGTVTVISAQDYSFIAQNKLKEKIGASPVAVDDVLYVRTEKHMYAFR